MAYIRANLYDPPTTTYPLANRTRPTTHSPTHNPPIYACTPKVWLALLFSLLTRIRFFLPSRLLFRFSQNISIFHWHVPALPKKSKSRARSCAHTRALIPCSSFSRRLLWRGIRFCTTTASRSSLASRFSFCSLLALHSDGYITTHTFRHGCFHSAIIDSGTREI